MRNVILLYNNITMLFASPPFGPTPCDPGQGTTGIDLGTCLKLSNGALIRNVYSTPADMINLIVKNVFVLAGVFLFGLILFAGFKFIKGGAKGLEEAKTVVTTALLGFIIMFSAYWILQVLKLVTGADIVI